MLSLLSTFDLNYKLDKNINAVTEQGVCDLSKMTNACIEQHTDSLAQLIKWLGRAGIDKKFRNADCVPISAPN